MEVKVKRISMVFAETGVHVIVSLGDHILELDFHDLKNLSLKYDNYISLSLKNWPSILEMKLPIFSNSIIKCCRNWCWFHHGQLVLERR